MNGIATLSQPINFQNGFALCSRTSAAIELTALRWPRRPSSISPAISGMPRKNTNGEIDNDETATAVLAGNVGKSPKIAEANCTADGRQQEARAARPRRAFLVDYRHLLTLVNDVATDNGH